MRVVAALLLMLTLVSCAGPREPIESETDKAYLRAQATRNYYDREGWPDALDPDGHKAH